jgi:Domain of unknown function (DUF4123)
MTTSSTERLIASLWPNDDLPTTPQVYALVDGARDRSFEWRIRLSRLEYCCLYAGRLSPALARAAPYLVHLTPKSQFTQELLGSLWGTSWGILTIVPPDCTLQQQRRHFRTLLRVATEDGRILAFRFYDPRVLRIFMPTCTPSELTLFFGPIPSLAAESEDSKKLLVFSKATSGLVSRSVPIFPAPTE